MVYSELLLLVKELDSKIIGLKVKVSQVKLQIREADEIIKKNQSALKFGSKKRKEIKETDIVAFEEFKKITDSIEAVKSVTDVNKQKRTQLASLLESTQKVLQIYLAEKTRLEALLDESTKVFDLEEFRQKRAAKD
jgi:ABC-type transporter Mla subunit MlaD